MKTKTKTKTPSPLVEALSPRVSAGLVRVDIADVRRAHRAERERDQAYAGGLKAEADSARAKRAARKADRRRVRSAWLSRQGRKIDLLALLNLSRADQHPVWAIVDPTREIRHDNGGCRDSGERLVAGAVAITGAKRDQVGTSISVPVGLPPLPARVRELATDLSIRKRARWVGVLYQPEEWRKVDPDPALVVEWKDLPGEYYALAVWGVDGPRIMEFVD